MRNFVGVVLIFVIFSQVSGQRLRCWSCSSDINRLCGDPFNTSDIIGFERGGSFYNNYPQNYNQRQYDPNNNNNYYPNNYNNNPPPPQQGNYNPSNYPFNFNPNERRIDLPKLEPCPERRGMKPVCLKEIVSGSAYTTIIRRCTLIPMEEYAGTCNRHMNRGLSQDYCQTCDWDGCNSASGLKTNILLGVLTLFITLLIVRA